MADGVDHIDIYADVGEEFNQVREGPGLRRRRGRCRGLDAWLTRAAAGREPASLQTVRPWRLRAAPPCATSPHPLFSRVVLRVAELWSAGPGRRAAAAAARPPPAARPFLRTASHPIVGSVAGASRRARPRVRGGENGPPRPLPRCRPEGEALVRRALAASIPALPLRVPIPPAAPFCVSVRARSPHGRPRS